MSFTDRHTSLLIGTGSLITGTLTKLDETSVLTNEGWDQLTVKYAKRMASCSAEELADLFPIGSQLGSRKFWISGARPIQKAAGFFEFDVDFKGWASDKPAVVKVGASADQQSAQNVLAPTMVGDTTGALFAKVETHENTPTIAVSYLVEDVDGSGISNTGKVGQALTPPVTIDVPDTVWSFLTQFVWHWPQGWVLMGSDQDRLPGTSAALITDNYKFIRDKTPG